MQHVENYEYELPSDFEDEEIDEDMAFTAEDKKLYAGWFGEDAADDGDEDAEADEGKPRQQQKQQQAKLSKREFAALDSSSDDDSHDEDEVGVQPNTRRGSCTTNMTDSINITCRQTADSCTKVSVAALWTAWLQKCFRRALFIILPHIDLLAAVHLTTGPVALW